MGKFFAPCAGVPGTPSRDLVQQVSNLEVDKGVEQGFLGADTKLSAGKRPLVSFRVVVHPIDLEQASIRPVAPFRYMGNVAIFVHRITATTIWAPTRFSQDDLAQSFVCFNGPTCFKGQCRKPRNIAVRKGNI